MRYEPDVVSQEKKEAQDKLTKEITRKVALALCFIFVFIFFFKILFF